MFEKLNNRNLIILILSLFFFFCIFLEIENIIIDLFILFFSLIFPGYVLVRIFFSKKNFDFFELISLSFFFGIIYMAFIGMIIHWIWALTKISLFIFIILVPIILYYFNEIKKENLKKTKRIEFSFKNFNFLTIFFLLISAGLISVLIHATPSFYNSFPLGFDTYRLHIIRINYIINNGKFIIGDIVTPDFLNPERYQWGYHLFIGILGIFMKKDAIFMLRIIPAIFSFFLPISIYTTSPFFNLKSLKSRILASFISPLFLFNPIIHGLVYPFPSSMSLILFIIILRFFYEYRTRDRKIMILFIILIPLLFFIYKGIGILYILVVISLIPYILYDLKNPRLNTNKMITKTSNKLILYSLILSIITTLFLALIYTTATSILYEAFIFKLNIIQIYDIIGILASLIFIISTFYVRYKKLKKENKKNCFLISIFIALFIISSGSFLGIRWLLYFIPFVVYFNTHLILFTARIIKSKLTNKLNKTEGGKSKRKYRDLFLIIPFFVLLSIEPTCYYINPPFVLAPDFNKDNELIYHELISLKSNSIILSTYTMDKYLSAFALDSNLIYTSNKSFLYFYEINTQNTVDIVINHEFDILDSILSDFIYDKIFIVVFRNEFENYNILLSSSSYIVYNNTSSAILQINII